VTSFPVLSPSGEYQDHESQYVIQQHFDQEKLPVDPPEDDQLTLTSIDPNQGLGDDTVTLTGTGLAQVTVVNIGPTPATGLNIISDTELICTTPVPDPPSVGPALDVEVIAGSQSATLPAAFTFIEV
jgi:hypothetical protein